jgi:hypothetical protein
MVKQIQIEMTFSRKQLDYLSHIQQKILLQEKQEKEIAQKEIDDDFRRRKAESDKYEEYIISKWLNIPNEFQRYDILTPYYLAIIEKLPMFSQSILEHFKQYPIPISSKEINKLNKRIDRTKTTSYFSNYTKYLVREGILELNKGYYSLKDQHLQNFLVMRGNRKFKKEITLSYLRENDQCISEFIKNNQLNFRESLESRLNQYPG